MLFGPVKHVPSGAGTVTASVALPMAFDMTSDCAPLGVFLWSFATIDVSENDRTLALFPPTLTFGFCVPKKRPVRVTSPSGCGVLGLASVTFGGAIRNAAANTMSAAPLGLTTTSNVPARPAVTSETIEVSDFDLIFSAIGLPAVFARNTFGFVPNPAPSIVIRVPIDPSVGVGAAIAKATMSSAKHATAGTAVLIHVFAFMSPSGVQRSLRQGLRLAVART